MITPNGLYTLTFYDVVRFVRTTFFDRLTENKYELYDDCRRTECVLVKPLFFGISAGGRGKQHGRFSRYGRGMIISIDYDRLQFEVKRVGLKLSTLS